MPLSRENIDAILIRIKYNKMPKVAHDGKVLSSDTENREIVDCNGC